MTGLSSADICMMKCLGRPRMFWLPPPGAPKSEFKFCSDDDRDLYFIMPSNHPARPSRGFNPRIMLLGLSPAGNQISGFLQKYKISGKYDEAAIFASFQGLEKDIITLLRGIGIERHFGISLSNVSTFARHPDFYTNSLVKCASLTRDGSSDAFDPLNYSSNIRCIIHRFYPEATNPKHTRLSHIFVFGRNAADALRSPDLDGNIKKDRDFDETRTIWRALERAGRCVVSLPHPSQGKEYINLASYPPSKYRTADSYASAMWEVYQPKPPRKGRGKEPEDSYKAKRRARWKEIARLRRFFEKPNECVNPTR